MQQGLILGFTFLIPLIFNPWGLVPYEPWKNVALYFTVAVCGILMSFHGIYRQKSMRAILLVLAIFAWGFWISDRPTISFFGSYYRFGGVVNGIAYLILFWSGERVFRDRIFLEKWLNVVELTGGVTAVYGILQWLGFDFMSSSIVDHFEGRSFSTLGLPTAFGEFLIFPICVATYRLFEKPWAYFRWAEMVLLLTALLTSGNRASFLAVGLMGLMLLNHRFRHFRFKKWTLCFLLLVMACGLTFRTPRSLEARWELWKMAGRNIAESSFLGSGPENFIFDSEQLLTVSYLEKEGFLSLPDRIHNEFLELTNDYGLWGSLAYLTLLIWIFKQWCTVENELRIFLLMALLGESISHFFGFSLATHASFFALFLAAFVALDSRASIEQKMPRWSSVVLVLISFGYLVWAFSLANLTHRIDRLNFSVAYGLQNEALEQAVRFKNSPFSEIYEIVAQVYLRYEDAAGAEASVQKALLLNHGTLSSLLLDAIIQEGDGHFEQAERRYHQIYRGGALSPNFYMSWAEFEYRQMDWKEATWTYELLLRRMPNPSHWDRIFWKENPYFIEILQHFHESRFEYFKSRL